MSIASVRPATRLYMWSARVFHSFAKKTTKTTPLRFRRTRKSIAISDKCLPREENRHMGFCTTHACITKQDEHAIDSGAPRLLESKPPASRSRLHLGAVVDTRNGKHLWTKQFCTETLPTSLDKLAWLTFDELKCRTLTGLNDSSFLSITMYNCFMYSIQGGPKK